MNRKYQCTGGSECWRERSCWQGRKILWKNNWAAASWWLTIDRILRRFLFKVVLSLTIRNKPSFWPQIVFFGFFSMIFALLRILSDFSILKFKNVLVIVIAKNVLGAQFYLHRYFLSWEKNLALEKRLISTLQGSNRISTFLFSEVKFVSVTPPKLYKIATQTLLQVISRWIKYCNVDMRALPVYRKYPKNRKLTGKSLYLQK